MCICISECVLCVLQIGTGFKDEDLEQHYNFLKVKWHSVTIAHPCLVKITTFNTYSPSLMPSVF